MAMAVLPHDIIVDILSRLPVKSLLRFRCVCKPWDSLISDTQFAKTHLNRANNDVNINRRRVLVSASSLESIDYEAYDNDDGDAAVILDFPLRIPEHRAQFVGSCNGLICLLVDLYILILLNPSTRDAMEVPKPSDIPRLYVHYGFGYDSSVDDYKLVRLARPPTSGGSDETQVEVFTLKTNSWRRIQDIHHSSKIFFHYGTFSNGALHWLVKHEIGQDVWNGIISFDLAAEKLQEVVVPLPDHDLRIHSMEKLTVLGGYLSILFRYDNYIDVWVMKEYGVKASWTKFFTRSCENETNYWFSPLCLSKNGELLWVLIGMDGTKLVMYNMKEKTSRKLMVRDDWEWFETVVYVESLVSVNGSVRTDKQCQAQPMRKG